MNISDDTLMKYVDHELSAAEQREVAALIAQDAALAARVESMQRMNRVFRQAFDPVLEEPIPERLSNLLAEDQNKAADNVIDLAAKRGAHETATSFRWPQLAAIAATLVIGVGVGRMSLDSAPQLSGGSDPLLVATGPVAEALSQQLSGENSGPVQVLLSYQNRAGHYCRSFTTGQARAVAGIACYIDARWQLQLLEPARQGDAGDYRLAGSAVPEALLRYIESEMQGDPLDAEQERSALTTNWQSSE